MSAVFTDFLRWALPTALLLSAQHSRAVTQNEFNLWGATFLQANLDAAMPNLRGWLDVQPRRMKGATVAIVRPGLGYALTQNLLIHGGYAFIGNWLDAGGGTLEHRLWEQAMFLWSAGPFELMLRARLEQRFSTADEGVGVRGRGMGRAAMRLRRDGSVMLVAWDEGFFNFNDTAWGPRQGYDQNRLFCGIGVQSASRGRFEVGYLNMHRKVDPDLQKIAHTVSMNVFLNF